MRFSAILSVLAVLPAALGALAARRDGSIYWMDGDYEGDTTRIRDSTMKRAVRDAYDDMVAYYQGRNQEPPSTMALLIWPSSRGGRGWYHSSTKGRIPTGRDNDYCLDYAHRYGGNCAEIGVMEDAAADVGSRSLRGAYLAVYGVKSASRGTVGFLGPCFDTENRNGCETLVFHRGATCITDNNMGSKRDLFARGENYFLDAAMSPAEAEIVEKRDVDVEERDLEERAKPRKSASKPAAGASKTSAAVKASATVSSKAAGSTGKIAPSAASATRSASLADVSATGKPSKTVSGAKTRTASGTAGATATDAEACAIDSWGLVLQS